MQVQIGLRGVVTTILPALGAILKLLGQNDCGRFQPILTPPLRLNFRPNSSTTLSLSDDLCQSVLVYRSPLRKLDASFNQFCASDDKA